MTEMTPCPHCKQTGTCANGEKEVSCSRCVASSINQFGKGSKITGDIAANPKGLPCCVCRGSGIAEFSKAKWFNGFGIFLAGGLVLLSFALLFVLRGTADFHQVLIFVSTLMGSIAGYYFAGERARSSATANAAPSADQPNSTGSAPAGGSQTPVQNAADHAAPLQSGSASGPVSSATTMDANS